MTAARILQIKQFQIAGVKANTRQQRLYSKGKLAFTRAKALDTLHTEGYAIPKSMKNASVDKAYRKWAQFYYMSIGVKPVGKNKRSSSHAVAAKAVEGHQVRQRLFGA